MGIHKTKTLCSKGTHQSNEHTTQWEKKFPSYTPDRGLVCRIFKKLKNKQTNNLDTKKTNNTTKNWLRN